MEPECDLPFNGVICHHVFVASMESPLGVSTV